MGAGPGLLCVSQLVGTELRYPGGASEEAGRLTTASSLEFAGYHRGVGGTLLAQAGEDRGGNRDDCMVSQERRGEEKEREKFLSTDSLPDSLS